MKDIAAGEMTVPSGEPPSPVSDPGDIREQHSGRAGQVTLVIDVGGSHVKASCAGTDEEVKIESGPDMTPARMISALREALGDTRYDRVSIGVPTAVRRGRIVNEPHNLGKGWVGFDFSSAFHCPVRVVNDAAMQALGSYRGGRMLFLGLGTGLGAALIVDGQVAPLEIAHLPWRKHDYEHYVANERRRKHHKKWHRDVLEVLSLFEAAFTPDYIVLGGGNADKIEALPDGVIPGENANAFPGGQRLWDDTHEEWHQESYRSRSGS